MVRTSLSMATTHRCEEQRMVGWDSCCAVAARTGCDGDDTPLIGDIGKERVVSATRIG